MAESEVTSFSTVKQLVLHWGLDFWAGTVRGLHLFRIWTVSDSQLLSNQKLDIADHGLN